MWGKEWKRRKKHLTHHNERKNIILTVLWASSLPYCHYLFVLNLLYFTIQNAMWNLWLYLSRLKLINENILLIPNPINDSHKLIHMSWHSAYEMHFNCGQLIYLNSLWMWQVFWVRVLTLIFYSYFLRG